MGTVKNAIKQRAAKPAFSVQKTFGLPSWVTHTTAPKAPKAPKTAIAPQKPPKVIPLGAGVFYPGQKKQQAAARNAFKQSRGLIARSNRDAKLAALAAKPVPNSFAPYEHAATDLYRGSGVNQLVGAAEHPGELIHPSAADRLRIDQETAQTTSADKQIAEFATGYKQIEHPGRDPFGAGLAIAGLLPFGKFGKVAEALRAADAADEAAKVANVGDGLGDATSKITVPRTPSEVEHHIGEQARKAAQEGFGRLEPKVPKIEPGQVTPETAGIAGQQVRQALAGKVDTSGMGPYEGVGAKLDAKSAAAARAEQEALRAPVRAQRAAAVESAAATGDGLERHVSALAQLKGELPKVRTQGLQGLDQESLNTLVNHIYDHPNLRPYEKIRTASGLTKMLSGEVPTKSEHALLNRAFGREATDGLMVTPPRTLREKALEALNVPRALMASFDLSAPFRQGLVVGVKQPKLFLKNFEPMVKAFGSEKVYQATLEDIHSRPTFPLMEKSGLSFTDIGSTLTKREEQWFGANYAEKIPVVGRGVRASDRAYVGFLNKTRADYFDLLAHQAAAEGHDLSDEHLLNSIAKFVNSATGRGDLRSLQKHAVTLNSLLFSPRLLASRLNFINPLYYGSLHPFVRREALKAARNLVVTMGAVLGLAKMAGATVVMDPRNADFGKIRIGNTRISIAGGFEQQARLVAQLFSGEIVSSTSGRLEHLSGGFGGKSRLDVLGQFLRGKLAPVPSVVADVLSGSQFGGQPITAKGELGQHLFPLLAQDAWSLRHHPATAAGTLPLDLFGIGIQSYGTQRHAGTMLSKLERDSVAAGLGKPPHAVLNDVKWAGALADATYSGQSAFDKAKAVIHLFDERYGANLEATVLPHLHTQGQAEAMYLELRSKLFPSLERWGSVISKIQAAKAAERPTPVTPPAPNPKPPTTPPPSTPAASRPSLSVPQAPRLQDVSYHTPATSPASHAKNDMLAMALRQLAAGNFNPTQVATKLLQDLSSHPIERTMTMPGSGQIIHFQIPRLSGKVGRAARGAIALAQHFLGTPYVWGGESPKGFDCSGLLQYIYAAQGIEIPRTSQEQFGAGTPVARSRLRPGDAVFFVGSDGTRNAPGHVGIYIGGGRFIEAPYTGALVRISKLAGYPGYVGARRYSKK